MRFRVLRITKLLALLVLALAVVTIIGCKKKTADEPAVQTQTDEIVQTTCPVMVGNPIDKNVFVMYQGKKVYFCCPECKAKFQADPEKYLDKLPQFKDQAESMKKQAEQAVDKTNDEMNKAAENMPDM
jgi:YHS domain-containing protein